MTSFAYRLMQSTALIGPLKRIPGLPIIFDWFLLGWTFLFQRERIKRLNRLERAVLGWDDVHVGVHRFGGMEFHVGRGEIGHAHGNGIVDVPLPRIVAERLLTGERVLPHHTISESGWVTVELIDDRAEAVALGLLRMAYERAMPTPPFRDLKGVGVSAPFRRREGTGRGFHPLPSPDISAALAAGKGFTPARERKRRESEQRQAEADRRR